MWRCGDVVILVTCLTIARGGRIVINALQHTYKSIDLVLSDDAFSDFEDGLQYYTALENETDIIITRNLKGFRSSKIPVMMAEQYLQR